MRKQPTPLNGLSKANQFTRKNSLLSSFLLSLGLMALASCSYLEDFVEPDHPKPGEEKMFSPVTFNRPVVPVYASADEATFIDPTVKITGAEHILLGRKIYIGPFASLLAGDENNAHIMTVANNQETKHARIKIEDETNIQDNVAIYADFERDQTAMNKINALHMEGVEIGERVILAHGCTVKGPAQIGIEGTDIPVDPDADQEVFISFGAEIDGAILEKNTGVSALGRVGPGVRLRSGFIVLPGKNVTTQEEADNVNLGKVRKLVEGDIEFDEEVLEVNIAFSKVYTQLFRDNPFNVWGINFDPGNTEFNPVRHKPEFAGVPTREPEFRNRIIGDIHFENSLQEFSSLAGNRIAIRADEGEPFTIGKIASIGNNVIFHALKETLIETGNNVTYGEGVIVHGGNRRPLMGGGDDEPTIVEDDVVLEDHAVVFRSLIGKGAKIGKRALIVSTDIAPGTVVPDKAIYIANSFFGTVEW